MGDRRLASAMGKGPAKNHHGEIAALGDMLTVWKLGLGGGGCDTRQDERTVYV